MKMSDYGLLRPSFQLDPELDSRIFVGRDDVRKKLEDRLKRAIVTGTAMHTVIFGEYGSGKTHTLNYVHKYLVGQNLEVLPILVRQPRVDQRSTPSALYASIISAISPTEIFNLFVKIYESAEEKLKQTAELHIRIEIINQYVKNRDLSFVLYKYVTTRPAEDYSVVRWLSGEKLSMRDKTLLSVITDNSDPNTAVQTLISLLKLFHTFGKKYVLLMLDELETFEVLSPKKQMDFQNFLRNLVDQTGGIAVLLAFTNRGGIENALPMFNPQSAIGTRVGYPQNYIHLQEFNDPELAKTFIRQLLHADGIRDPKVNVETLCKKLQNKVEEDLSEDFFPFTKQAVELIYQQSLQSSIQNLLLPRDIEKVMTDCLGDAMSLEKPFIDTEIVQHVMKE